jgi:hypothetical protein
MTYYGISEDDDRNMSAPLVATVNTICPECRCSYQRPVNAKELIAGGAPKLIVCEYCNKQTITPSNPGMERMATRN